MVHTENNFKNEKKKVNMRFSQKEISVSKTNPNQPRDLTRNDKSRYKSEDFQKASKKRSQEK